MRTILIVLSLVIIGILSIPMYLVEFIIGRFSPMTMHKTAQAIVRVVFRFWLWLSGTDYTVTGIENIPKDEPVLFVANHRSFYDAFLGYAVIPNPTSFVAKKSIKKIPVIAQWMYFLSCMFLDREDLKSGMEVIKKCISLVNSGYSIFIAPEGTRNSEEELLPFKEGSFRIATRTNCKIVPLCYTNTESAFEAHVPWVRKAKVTMDFGEPVDISSMDREERKHLGEKMRKVIQQMYDERRKS